MAELVYAFDLKSNGEIHMGSSPISGTNKMTSKKRGHFLFKSKLDIMIIAIDDSGDPGLKMDKGSSSYFVIVAAVFLTDHDAEATALKIERFRQTLKVERASRIQI